MSKFELARVVLKVERAGSELVREGNVTDETVILKKIGKFWNEYNRLDRPDGLVLVTNYRLVFLAKIKVIALQTDFLSFPFEFMNNLETTRISLVSPAIRFHIKERKFTFTFLSNAEEVFEAITQKSSGHE